MSIFDIFKKSKKDYDAGLKNYGEMVAGLNRDVVVDRSTLTVHRPRSFVEQHDKTALDALKMQVASEFWAKDLDDFRITKNRMVETDEAKVVRILKGDFEAKFGITFEKFTETYHKMIEECPERLI